MCRLRGAICRHASGSPSERGLGSAAANPWVFRVAVAMRLVGRGAQLGSESVRVLNWLPFV